MKPGARAEESSAAGNNIREMKGRATVDHLWETMGNRPACVNDLEWIEVARKQAEAEAEHRSNSPVKKAEVPEY